MKILIGPEEVAGYYTNLAQGFRELGVDCDYVTYNRHPFGYREDNVPTLVRFARILNRFLAKSERPFIIKALIVLPRDLLLMIWSIHAAFKYDVFIFGFGHSLIPRTNFDLRLLEILKKTVISNLGHGTDARPPYISGSHQSKDGRLQPTTRKLFRLSKAKKRRVCRIEKHSSFVVGAPASTTHFAERTLINWFSIGVPFTALVAPPPTCGKNASDTKKDLRRRLRILHAPSHPSLKGTALILKAIQNLKDKGHSIELVKLENKHNSEVIREIQACDFIIDQVYSDTPMAGFAAEAAWFGKPSVVAGYRFEYLKSLVPKGMWPPSKTCLPNKLERAIEDLIVNREERLRLGAEAQQFVHEKWGAAQVARRFLRLIEHDIPENWWLNPKSVTYLHGCGQPAERTKENIRKMVSTFGVASLQLTHRPELEKEFLDFSGIDSAE